MEGEVTPLPPLTPAATPDPVYRSSAPASARVVEPEPAPPAEEAPQEPAAPPEPVVDDQAEVDAPPEEAAPEEPAAPPAPELDIEEAKKLLATDPEAFALKFGGPMAPRFAKLAQKNAALRKQEAEIKAREATVKKAEAYEQEMRENPIAFAEKHFGQDFLQRWAQFVVEQQKGGNAQAPQLAPKPPPALEDHPKVKELEAQVRALHMEKAKAYLEVVETNLGTDDGKKAVALWGKDAVINAVIQLRAAAMKEGKDLTAKDAVGRVIDESKKRLEAVLGKSAAPTGAEAPKATPPKAKPAASTLTTDLTAAVPRGQETFPNTVRGERERMKAIAAKFSGR